MPKKTFTFNGFLGGLHFDSDESDLTSAGKGKDELLRSEGFFMDEPGRLNTKMPHFVFSDMQTSGYNVSDLKIINEVAYNQRGAYAFDEYVNYSGNLDFVVTEPAYGYLNYGITNVENYWDTGYSNTPTANYVPDVLWEPVIEEGSVDEFVLFLGKSAPSNPLGRCILFGTATQAGEFNRPRRYIANMLDYNSTGDFGINGHGLQEPFSHWQTNINGAYTPDDDDGGWVKPVGWGFAGTRAPIGIFPIDEGHPQVHMFRNNGNGYPDNSTTYDGGADIKVHDHRWTRDSGLDWSDYTPTSGTISSSDYVEFADVEKFLMYHDGAYHATSPFLAFRAGWGYAYDTAEAGYGSVVQSGGDLVNGWMGEHAPDLSGMDVIIDVWVKDSTNLEYWMFIMSSKQDCIDTYMGSGTTSNSNQLKAWRIDRDTLAAAGCFQGFGRIILNAQSYYHQGEAYKGDTEVTWIATGPKCRSYSWWRTGAGGTTGSFAYAVREIRFSRQGESLLKNRRIAIGATNISNDVESVLRLYNIDHSDLDTAAESQLIEEGIGRNFLTCDHEMRLSIRKPLGSEYGGTLSYDKGNIYIQEVDGGDIPVGDAFLLATWDLEKGVLPTNSLTGDWEPWTTLTGTQYETDGAVWWRKVFKDLPVTSTYALESGYPMGTKEVNADFRHAAVVGRQVYIGNLRQPPGSGSYEKSKVLKSAIGRAAGFSDLSFIDFQLGGDEITAMYGVGDRLIVFSTLKMIIVNVAGDVEYLEATIEHQGVESKSQIVQIGEGLAWVNASGVYFFDGSQIVPLSEEKMNSVRWEVTEGDTVYSPKIAYDPKRKILWIWTYNTDYVTINGNTYDGAGSTPWSVYWYSFKTKSWIGHMPFYHTGDSLLPWEPPATESATGPRGENYYVTRTSIDSSQSQKLVKTGDVLPELNWNDTGVIETGKISLGDIGRVKKFNKLIMSAGCDEGTSLYLRWRTDKNLNYGEQQTINVSNEGEYELKLDAKGGWIQFEISTAQNFSKTLNIKEITIVYRELLAR